MVAVVDFSFMFYTENNKVFDFPDVGKDETGGFIYIIVPRMALCLHIVRKMRIWVN